MNKGFNSNALKRIRKINKLNELENLRTLLLVIRNKKEQEILYLRRKER